MRSAVLASTLCGLLISGLTGCGLVLDTSPPDPVVDDTTVHECETNDDCDDDADCTTDVCLHANDAGAPRGCYHVPQDNACSPTTVANACAKYVCAPSATWDSSGCAVAPQAFACGDRMRCNLDSLQCEQLPATCDGCDDGDPCNGVETCDSSASTEVCTRTAPGCGESNEGCKRYVCDTRADDRQCRASVSPLAGCLMTGP